MRLYLICDNEDTALGLRLAGIEGTVTESRDEVRELFEKAAKDQLGLEIDKKKIVLNTPIKAIGSFEVSVKLHKDVTAKLAV